MPQYLDKEPLTTASVLLLLKDLATERQEHFYVLSLDAGRRLISKKLVFLGTATSSVCHPREVFYQAITDGAVSIVICHNHPSGDPEPSKADIEVTQQLAAGGQILGIPLADHITIATGGHYSFAENGLLLPYRLKNRGGASGA